MKKPKIRFRGIQSGDGFLKFIDMKKYTPKKVTKKPKYKKDYPRITIERYGTDSNGRITFIDIHDEKFGTGIYFGQGSGHFHGHMNGGVFKE